MSQLHPRPQHSPTPTPQHPPTPQRLPTPTPQHLPTPTPQHPPTPLGHTSNARLELHTLPSSYNQIYTYTLSPSTRLHPYLCPDPRLRLQTSPHQYLENLYTSVTPTPPTHAPRSRTYPHSVIRLFGATTPAVRTRIGESRKYLVIRWGREAKYSPSSDLGSAERERKPRIW